MYIGVELTHGKVFEGGGTYGAHALWPLPLLTPAKIISEISESDILEVAEIDSFNLSQYLFREDSFDPVTRIRRGRFYKRETGAHPNEWTVQIDPSVPITMHQQRQSVVSFVSLNSSELDIKNGQQLLVILGSKAAFSMWTVIHKEVVHTREVLVTLRARQSFGALPEIDWKKISDENNLVKGKIDALLNDVFRAGAESIVDRAREAAAAILNAYLQSEKVLEASGKDLGALIDLLEKKNGRNGQRVVRCAAEIPQRLHSRAKSSEQEKHGEKIRSVTEQDAELAVQCIGVMLCDLGWARWV